MSSREASSSSCDPRLARVLELAAAIGKGLGYAAALSGAGMALARASLLPGRESLPVLSSMIRAAGGVLAACALWAALMFLLRLGGGLQRELLQAVLLSPLGAALALQLVGGLWLLGSAARPAALVGALLALLAFAVVGHSASRGLVTSATVLLHVVAAAWWLGGLWLLLVASRQLPRESLSPLVARFSRTAVWAVVVLLAGALVTAAQLLEYRFSPERAYDRGLLAKAGLTSGLLVLASVNRWVLSPRLASDPGAVRWLRRSLLAEFVLMATVLAVTAWLTTWQSPHNPHLGHGEATDRGNAQSPEFDTLSELS